MLEQEQEFEMAPPPPETPASIIKIHVIEGMSSLEVEGPEPTATHILNQWYLRMDASRSQNAGTVERILQARTMANGSGQRSEDIQ